MLKGAVTHFYNEFVNELYKVPIILRDEDFNVDDTKLVLYKII